MKYSKKRKYTDEELSRILSAHEGELLRRGGLDWGHQYKMPLYTYAMAKGCGCINQIAYNCPKNWKAILINLAPAKWFDFNYIKYMSTDNLLKKIEEVTQ